MIVQRVGANQLVQLRQQLVPRDVAVLTQVADLRLISARQIEAVHFPREDHATKAAAARASRRVLERLTRERLLSRLERRVGGVYAGSAGYVYTLGPVGHRLLELNEPRPRLREPSKLFAEHTLAISQLVVDLTLAHRAEQLELLQVQTEPECWRRIPGLERRILRPDLFVAVGAGELELRWFVEVDRSTVEIPRLLRKCHLYEAYYRSGAEQQAHGVFPRVLWITKKNRGQTLMRAIRQNQRLTARLFLTTTTNDAIARLVGGAA
jgi:hypothetical protein